MPYRANSILNDLKGRILVQPVCITDPCGHGGTFNPPSGEVANTNRRFCGTGDTPEGFLEEVGWCDGPNDDDDDGKQVPSLSLDMYFPNWINQTCLNRCTEASCGSGELTRGTCVPSSSYSTGGIDCVDCKCPYTNACETLTEDECNGLSSEDSTNKQEFKARFGSKTAENIVPCEWNDDEKKCRRTADETSQLGGLQNTCSFRIEGVISSGDVCMGGKDENKYGSQSLGLCCTQTGKLDDCTSKKVTVVPEQYVSDPNGSVYKIPASTTDIYICDPPN